MGDALSLLQKGEYVRAERLLARLRQDLPDNPVATHAHGVCKFQMGHQDEGISLLKAACELDPSSHAATYDLGCALATIGQLADAVTIFRRLYELRPQHPGLALNFGRALFNTGSKQQAIEVLRPALDRQPRQLALLWLTSGVYRDLAKMEEASAAWERALTEGAATEQLYAAYSQFMSESNLPDRALTVLETGLHYFPASSSLKVARAQIYEYLGKRDLAEQDFREILAREPDHPHALAGLIELNSDVPEQMRKRAESVASTTKDLTASALINYALGKVENRRKDPEKAFAAWRRGNSARRREVGAFNRAEFSRRVDRIIDGTDRSAIAKAAGSGVDSKKPVLVVGMPRSGTTLVEQVIAAHPEAHGLGELQDLPIALGLLLNDENGVQIEKDWALEVEKKSPGQIKAAAESYISALERRAPGAARAVDKAPMNFLNLGGAAVLMPKASILWCLRDPRDVALSIFSQNFARSQSYATDLGDIAFVYYQHLRLFFHWAEALPSPPLPVRYRSLVHEPEQVMRKMIRHIDLEWSDACLAFHENETTVQTPSRWQVRQPLYQTSLDRWRPFEAHLSEFVDDLTRLDATTGYVKTLNLM